MTSLKQSIFWIAFYLTAIVVFAQYDYTDYPIIDFAKYFYFAAIMVIPATVFFPSVSKVNVLIPLVIWGCIYMVLLQVVDRTASSTGPFAVIVLEFILIETGAWLGYQLANGIKHAESVMDAMALTAFPNRTQYIHESAKQIKTEFTRSRRFHRPLSMLLMQVVLDEHVQIKEMIASIQHDLLKRFSFARIGLVIDDQIRQTDIVFRDQNNRFVILCPETDRGSAEILAKRLGEAIKHRTGVHVLWGSAGFPEDAINFDDLMDVAVSRIAHPDRQGAILPNPESVEVHP